MSTYFAPFPPMPSVVLFLEKGFQGFISFRERAGAKPVHTHGGISFVRVPRDGVVIASGLPFLGRRSGAPLFQLCDFVGRFDNGAKVERDFGRRNGVFLFSADGPEGKGLFVGTFAELRAYERARRFEEPAELPRYAPALELVRISA